LNRRQFAQFMAGTLAGNRVFGQSRREPLNFLFVLTDDLGWHDTGPYGNGFIDTPNFHRFAAESARFTNAYAACPVCSPTRASILTGRYPARLRLTDWIPGRKQWPYSKLLKVPFRQELPIEETTIAEVLRPAGYSSAAIGKWHLGGTGFGPTQQGFDLNIAGNAAGSPPTYFGPLTLPNLSLRPGEFLTERLTQEALRFIDGHASSPFFLYHASFTVHIPLQAPPDLLAKYKARHTTDVDPTYCAMVETADQSFGRLLKAVENGSMAKRTVVIFFSDNGGVRYQEKRPAPITNNSPLRAGKGHLYEGGIREPLMIRWPGVTRAGMVIDEPVSSIDFFPTLCAGAGLPIASVDGVDLAPLLRSESIAPRPIFWHYPHYSDQGGVPSGAVRQGDWKLIEFYEDGRLELFNLASDIGEKRNLAGRESGRARQMQKLLADWRRSVDAVMPAENPRYDPARCREGLTGYELPTPEI
jgi:arylsulfatase A